MEFNFETMKKYATYITVVVSTGAAAGSWFSNYINEKFVSRQEYSLIVERSTASIQEIRKTSLENRLYTIQLCQMIPECEKNKAIEFERVRIERELVDVSRKMNSK